MIQATTNTSFKAYIQTADNRITDTTSDKIIHLFKFTNDMSGAVQYAYPAEHTISNRYTYAKFVYDATPNTFTGKVDLKPAGYWKYEVYEVYFADGVPLTLDTRVAPATEQQVLTAGIVPIVADGVLKGLVTKGKLYVSEKAGTEEINYLQSAKSVISVDIIYSGGGYPAPPTLTFSGGGNPITQATATCTINGAGAITSVTITNGGSGYTETPTLTVSDVGLTGQGAQLQANINQENYIYTG